MTTFIAIFVILALLGVAAYFDYTSRVKAIDPFEAYEPVDLMETNVAPTVEEPVEEPVVPAKKAAKKSTKKKGTKKKAVGTNA